MSVQRDIGEMWDFTKRLLGFDSAGDKIKKGVNKVKSGVETGEKELLDWLRRMSDQGRRSGGSSPETMPQSPPPQPHNRHPGEVSPYLNFEMEDALVSGYNL
jgi:hypothetical protein